MEDGDSAEELTVDAAEDAVGVGALGGVDAGEVHGLGGMTAGGDLEAEGHGGKSRGDVGWRGWWLGLEVRESARFVSGWRTGNGGDSHHAYSRLASSGEWRSRGLVATARVGKRVGFFHLRTRIRGGISEQAAVQNGNMRRLPEARPWRGGLRRRHRRTNPT